MKNRRAPRQVMKKDGGLYGLEAELTAESVGDFMRFGSRAVVMCEDTRVKGTPSILTMTLQHFHQHHPTF